MNYKIVESTTPDNCYINIKNYFRGYSSLNFRDHDASDYQVFHLQKKEKTFGSVVFRYYWQSIELKYLVVNSDMRKKGLGSMLLSFVYDIALYKKCNFINVETIYEDTLKFYEKHGYIIEFIRGNYSNNKKRFYLIKHLSTHCEFSQVR